MYTLAEFSHIEVDHDGEYVVVNYSYSAPQDEDSLSVLVGARVALTPGGYVRVKDPAEYAGGAAVAYEDAVDHAGYCAGHSGDAYVVLVAAA